MVLSSWLSISACAEFCGAKRSYIAAARIAGRASHGDHLPVRQLGSKDDEANSGAEFGEADWGARRDRRRCVDGGEPRGGSRRERIPMFFVEPADVAANQDQSGRCSEDA